MAWTRTRGSEVADRGMKGNSAALLLPVSERGRGNAVRLVCFFKILRVASVLANWNYRIHRSMSTYMKKPINSHLFNIQNKDVQL
jgi:hypothetical protein